MALTALHSDTRLNTVSLKPPCDAGGANCKEADFLLLHEVDFSLLERPGMKHFILLLPQQFTIIYERSILERPIRT